MLKSYEKDTSQSRCFRKATSQKPGGDFNGRHTSTAYKDFYGNSIEETWVWMTIIQMYWMWKGSLKKYSRSREFPGLQPRPGSRRKSKLLIACWRKTVLKATTSITHGCRGGFMFHRGETKMTSAGCHVSCVDSIMGTQRGTNVCARTYGRWEYVLRACGQHHVSAVKKHRLMLVKHAQPVTHASVCSLAGQSGLIPFYRSDKQLTQARNAGHEYIRYPPLPPPRTTKRKNRAINGRSSHTSLQAARRHLHFASFSETTGGFC